MTLPPTGAGLKFRCPQHGEVPYSFVSEDLLEVIQQGKSMPLAEIEFVSIGKVDEEDYPWVEGFTTAAYRAAFAEVLSPTFVGGTEDTLPLADAAGQAIRKVCLPCLQSWMHHQKASGLLDWERLAPHFR